MSHDLFAFVVPVLVPYVVQYAPVVAAWVFDECGSIATDMLVEPIIHRYVIPAVRRRFGRSL
jgi:hypothetical protein